MIDLSKIQKIHFTGIKGVGMTALALAARDYGMRVSGSDLGENFVTDQTLKIAKIKWRVGFSTKIGKPDLLVHTAAHTGAKNIEVITAKKKKILVLSHAQALGVFMKNKIGISVCGVGGKTTTSAMIASIFNEAKLNPSYAIGAGGIHSLKLPGKYTTLGKYFIAEADEYFSSPQDPTPRFLYQNPEIIVITNIEFDHPDVYKNLGSTLTIFKKFINKLPKDGLLICNIDNLNIQKITKEIKVKTITYGFSSKADWRINSIKQIGESNRFEIFRKKQLFGRFYLPLPGQFNVQNALGAIIVSHYCGINNFKIKKGLASFYGVKRRFELVKKIGEIKLYDDYAHHPLEIKATLDSAKKWFANKRLIAVFQPHTYSRTKALLKDFSQAFLKADMVIITDIYASQREKKDSSISGKILADKISQYQKEVYYQKDVIETADFLNRIAKPGDVIFTLGAGDIFNWHGQIIKALSSL